MKFVDYLERQNVAFGKAYMRVYAFSKRKRYAAAISERLVDYCTKIGAYIEGIISGLYGKEVVPDIILNLNSARYVAKVMYSAKFARDNALTSFMKMTALIESLVSLPWDDGDVDEDAVKNGAKKITYNIYDPDGFSDDIDV